MEYLGYVVAFLSLCISLGAMHRISILEHKLKTISEPVDYVILINTLKENIGKEIKLDFFENINILAGEKCVVLDIDDAWVLVEYKKKEIKKILIRLDNIKNVTVL